MKIIVSMKDPDTLNDAIEDAVKNIKIEGVSEEEMDFIRENRIKETQSLCSEWFEWGEYLRVEIDTEAKTCVVIPTEESL